MKHDEVEANRISLHFVEEGEGPAVVFCHGFPAQSTLSHVTGPPSQIRQPSMFLAGTRDGLNLVAQPSPESCAATSPIFVASSCWKRRALATAGSTRWNERGAALISTEP